MGAGCYYTHDFKPNGESKLAYWINTPEEYAGDYQSFVSHLRSKLIKLGYSIESSAANFGRKMAFIGSNSSQNIMVMVVLLIFRRVLVNFVRILEILIQNGIWPLLISAGRKEKSRNI